MPTALGIDLGTTQIKACLINENKRIIVEKELPHHALIPPTPNHPNWHEQCPLKILKTVSEVLDGFPLNKDALQGIAISGQMHGVVLWNAASLQNAKGKAPFESIQCSNLVTWMDGRCTPEFLSKLPKWVDELQQPKMGGRKVSTGYGIATLAWMRESGSIHPRWNRAGTIMDFLACFLTTNSEVLMSTQNAEGWGYANGDEWAISSSDKEVAKIIPLEMLPEIVSPEHIVGKTTRKEFAGLPLGVPVFAGLGDLHSSLLPVLRPNEAVIHIGTSAQVVILVDTKRPPTTMDTSNLRLMPYFDGQYLLVAAALNGGNALTAFIDQIAQWSNELFGTSTSAQKLKEGFLDSVLNNDEFAASDVRENGESATKHLKVNPLFYGERHCPEAGATVENWHPNTPVKSFLREIARGTVRNLAELMPQQLLLEQGIKKMKLINKASQAVYRTEAKYCFAQLDEVYADNSQKLSAAYGAAIFALINALPPSEEGYNLKAKIVRYY